MCRLVSPSEVSAQAEQTTEDLEELKHPTSLPDLIDTNEAMNKQKPEHTFLQVHVKHLSKSLQ